MITGIFRVYKLFLRTLRGEDSPKQIAFGIAIGMAVGLIPKDNLIAIILATVVMATRINMFSAILSGFAFAWVGFMVDPVLHRLGAIILTADLLNPVWTYCYETPVVPWTRFNNTTVMGALALAVALFYPVYQISLSLLNRFGPRIHERLSRFSIYRRLSGVKAEPEGSPS